ncbi:hypothetical protein ACP70R_033174 [Stipagrostis hirtigluma subsp. patula]
MPTDSSTAVMPSLIEFLHHATVEHLDPDSDYPMWRVSQRRASASAPIGSVVQEPAAVLSGCETAR